MTLSSTTVRKQYNGDGTTASFPTTFSFWDDTDLTVTLTDSNGTDTTWTNGTQYTVTGGDGSTGTVVVSTTPTDYTPANGEVLTISSNVPNTQTTALPAGGAFPSTSVEQELDRMVRRVQQHEDDLARSIHMPEADPSTLSMELPGSTQRANQLLSFDANGNVTTTASTDTSSNSATATGATTARTHAAHFADVYHIDDWAVAADGTTDDSAKIQAAIDQVESVGGGTILFDGKVYAIANTLTIDSDNVHLRGVGAGQSANFAEWNSTGENSKKRTEFSAIAGFPSTQAMLVVTSDTANTQTYATHGVRVEGIFFDTNDLADYCIKVRSVHMSYFYDIFGRQYNVTGMEIDGTPASPTDHATYNHATRLCSFDMIAMHSQSSGSAIGIELKGSSAGNVNYCRFGRIQAAHHNGPGLKLSGCDSNTFDAVYTFATGSGYGIDINGSSQSNNRARENLIFYADCTKSASTRVGGIISRNSTVAPPNNNVLLHYGQLNVPGAIVVEEGTGFYYDQARYDRNLDDTTVIDFRISNSNSTVFPRDAYVTRVQARTAGSSAVSNMVEQRHVIYGSSGSEQSRQEFHTWQSGALGTRAYIGQGLVIGNPSSLGDQGANTINATEYHLSGSTNSENPSLRAGVGTPEGTVTAARGSLYLQTSSSIAAYAYVKTSSAAASSGWQAITST